MSDEIRVNRPQGQPQQQYTKPESTTMGQPEGKPPVSKMPWIVLGVIVVILIIGAIIFRGQLSGKHNPGAAPASGQMVGTTPMADVSGYQAVFLTNGQVYFGKMSNADGDYATLDDIYYLQVGPQQGSATAPNAASSTAQQQISLVKLGNELHGPVDEMHISRSQILFYEDLKSDGQVVKAIMQDKASATTPAPAPAK